MASGRRGNPDRARSSHAGSGGASGWAAARGQQDRTRIAQAAARLIAEHGQQDWSLAKRKAARQLLLPASTPLPSNDEIELALAEFQALFGGDAHARSLRAQRAHALAWMQRMSSWAPLLVGGVAAGWASAHADIHIELAADDPKAVEMSLAGAGVAYRALPAHAGEHGTELLIEETTASIRLSIVGANDRRSRPRSATDARLDLTAVRALLDGA